MEHWMSHGKKKKKDVKYIPTQAEIGDYALFLGKACIEIKIEEKVWRDFDTNDDILNGNIYLENPVLTEEDYKHAEEIQEKISNIDGNLRNEFVSYPIPKRILEEYKKL